MVGDRPDNLWAEIEPVLGLVERPSRYLGGEWNAPEIESGAVSVALAYPDVYEIGIGNLGLAILQEVVNDIDGACAERVYAPWVDMEKQMRSSRIPLFTLETHRPVASCDIFGISIPHELTFTNILNLMDLAGLPLRSSERDRGPLVVGGGCGAANPEPLAPFFDLFALGEGEEVIGELVDVVARGRSAGWDRERILAEAAGLDGVYRPALYEVSYLEDGRPRAAVPAPGARPAVGKRVVDIDRWLYPRAPIVPFCEAVHDRLNVELFRGCTRGCRFCQAGMITRPVRERTPGNVTSLVARVAGVTGHEEVSLCSLSSTDYTRIEDVARRVAQVCEGHSMTLTLPSLRMDGFSVELVSGLAGGGRGGMTFAPEAGTMRLRQVMNKPITEDEMADAINGAVRAGRRRVKLYFMIGLPTETDEDVEEIGRLVYRLRDAVRSAGLPPPAFNVSVSTFVPKAHTPFQWVVQDDMVTIERKQRILQGALRSRGVNLSWHDSEMSTVEGLLARGDRRLAGVVERAWAAGGRFDSWSEHFDYSRWESACSQEGVDPSFYLYRERTPDEVFPWDHLDFGLDKRFLREEYERALRCEVSPDCRSGECIDCGVCPTLGVEQSIEGEWR